MPNQGPPMTTEEKCWLLTGTFEGNGYTGLTGNFDGQGWSFGLLSWACGQGTLQPMIRAMHDAGAETFQKCCTVEVAGRGIVDLSPDLLAWCAMPVDEAVLWAASRCQDDPEKHPLPHWTAAFKSLGEVPGFQAIQRQHGASYMDTAHRIARNLGFESERGLALCFDIAVQDGSVKPEALAAFQKTDPSSPEESRLIALAHAVADASAFPADVASRKMCIATGAGVVHGVAYSIAKWPGLTLGPIVA